MSHSPKPRDDEIECPRCNGEWYPPPGEYELASGLYPLCDCCGDEGVVVIDPDPDLVRCFGCPKGVDDGPGKPQTCACGLRFCSVACRQEHSGPGPDHQCPTARAGRAVERAREELQQIDEDLDRLSQPWLWRTPGCLGWIRVSLEELAAIRDEAEGAEAIGHFAEAAMLDADVRCSECGHAIAWHRSIGHGEWSCFARPDGLIQCRCRAVGDVDAREASK